MQCERCRKNEATVHITRVVNGDRKEHHYCETCATTQENIDFDTPFAANSFLTSLIESIQSTPIKVNYIKTTTCSKCGMNYGRFKQTGRLGCDECYRAFEDKLMPLIKRVQGNDRHTGKVLGRASGSIRLKREIEQLKGALQHALAAEAYEEAATLRDQIRALEKEYLQEGGVLNA